MKPLPKIDLGEYYQKEIETSDKSYRYMLYSKLSTYRYTAVLKELIKQVEEESNPISFRNQLLAIIQLYFDGLLSRSSVSPKEKEILNDLCLIGKNFVGSFYRGEPVLDAAKEVLLSNATKIIRYGDKIPAKYRHLETLYAKVQLFGHELPSILDKIGVADVLVPVASGGFEPSFLALDILERSCESLFPIRFSHFVRYDYEAKSIENASFKDKQVLVIEDVISSGRSLLNVMDYVFKSGANDVYGTAAVAWDDSFGALDPQLPTIQRHPFICKYRK